MDLFHNEELSIKLCKFFGPPILFVFSPLTAYAIISVTLKEFEKGAEFDLSVDGLNFTIILIFFGFGFWACKKGYGWFGGEK